MRNAGMQFTCAACGNVVPAKPSKMRRLGAEPTCSRACFRTLRGPRAAVCRQCGAEWMASRSRAIRPYCSTKCYADSMRGKGRGRDKEKKRVKDRRCKVKKMTGDPGTLTHAEWMAILAAYEHRCAYCGSDQDITMDHVIPASKGGRHEAANVVPACFFCNRSKRDRIREPRRPSHWKDGTIEAILRGRRSE